MVSKPRVPRTLPPQLETIRRRAADLGQGEVVALLCDPATYPHAPGTVEAIETHMSLVFIAGDLVFKMKRAIALRFIDARQPQMRQQYCQRELELNQTLAPQVYLRIATVTREADGSLALDGSGEPMEWLVVMRRLDEAQSLKQRLAQGPVEPEEIDQVVDVLTDFYSRTGPAPMSADEFLQQWSEGVDCIRDTLTDPQFGLDPALVAPPLALLTRFLADDAGLIAERVHNGLIIDGHGDLKPGHVYLGPPILLIDRLEFAPHLRWCDPYDEAIALAVECTMLGAPWIGARLIDRLDETLGHRPCAALLGFYHCYRACLRARLSIEHLLDDSPRTPERWPRQTRAYLQLAMQPPQS